MLGRFALNYFKRHLLVREYISQRLIVDLIAIS
jgi:hypothetical protein